MKTHQLTRIFTFAALAASLASSVGCSGGAGDGDTVGGTHEKTGTSGAAVTESPVTASEGGYFDEGALQIALRTVHFFDSTLFFNTSPCAPCVPADYPFGVCPVCPGIPQSTLTFLASSQLVQQFPALGTSPPTLQLPIVNENGATVIITSFALPIAQVILTMNPNDLEITAPFSGSRRGRSSPAG